MRMSSTQKRPFSFAAAVGAGMTAVAAEKGGAEFLLLLNAGRLRMRGAASLSCYLPLEEANSWVARIGKTEVLNKCKIPVLMGCSVANPNSNLKQIVDVVSLNGFAGVTNFPTAALIDGKIRGVLERQGIGFNRECALIKEASDRGFKTLAYVTNNEEAMKMVDAGAGMLCVNIGFTHSATSEPSDITIDNTAKIIDRALRNVPEEIPTYVEGGPIVTPESALAICNKSRVQGYIAGSTIDRFPLEDAIVNVAKSYRIISQIESESVSSNSSVTDYIYGPSAKMREIQKLVEHYAAREMPILITGSSGSGKTALAEEIHRKSENVRSKMIRVDCLGLSQSSGAEELFGSELGHQGRGSPSHAGILEDADNATVLFDEIAALDNDLQTRLLSFIDTGIVRRMGGNRHRKVNCRVIATTKEPIADLLNSGKLRDDLYYRLNALEITIPSLADRSADIPALTKAMLTKNGEKKQKSISNSGFNALMEYSWPGNIRELKNALTRAALVSDSNTLKSSIFSFLPQIAHKKPEIIPLQEVGQDPQPQYSKPAITEKEWIAEALQRNRFRRGETADELGITTRTLYSKIKKYGIYSP